MENQKIVELQKSKATAERSEEHENHSDREHFTLAHPAIWSPELL